MPNFIQFTPEILNSVSLSVLREIARQVGVKSPSSKSVPALISEIILIQSGKLEPVKSNRGAHSKPVDVSAYYEVFYEGTPEERVEYVPKPIPPIELRDSHIFDGKGYYQRAKDGVAYLRGVNYSFKKDDAIIPEKIIDDFDLRQGDFVECKVIHYPDKKVVADLVTTNGKKAIDHIQFMDFADLSAYYPEEEIQLKGCAIGDDIMKKAPINKGQRAVLAVPPSVDKSLLGLELANSIKNNNENLETILLFVGENPEEICEIKRATNAQVVATKFDTDFEIQTATSELVIERAKRIVEHADDVVVIINSATNLVKAYLGENGDDGSLQSSLVPALMKVKKLTSSALNTSAGSCTILSIVDYTDNALDKAIFEELNRFANMRAVLTSQNTIDENLSFTKRYITADKGGK